MYWGKSDFLRYLRVIEVYNLKSPIKKFLYSDVWLYILMYTYIYVYIISNSLSPCSMISSFHSSLIAFIFIWNCHPQMMFYHCFSVLELQRKYQKNTFNKGTSKTKNVYLLHLIHIWKQNWNFEKHMRSPGTRSHGEQKAIHFWK